MYPHTSKNNTKIKYIDTLLESIFIIKYNKDKDIALVMRMLNHQNPEHTLRYIGVEQQNIDDAYETYAIGEE